MNLSKLLHNAFQARAGLVKKLEREDTDTWRMFHGVNEGRPGLTIDRYGSQVLIQAFQHPLLPGEIQEIKSAVSEYLGFSPAFVYNDRSGKKVNNVPIDGEADPGTPFICKEFGIKYRVIGVHRGQDPLLFIDLRAGRRFVRQNCKAASVLNLFAYTCGVGIAAAASGADLVWNVDFSGSSLEYGKENAALNHIPNQKIRFIQQDVLAVIRQLSGLGVKGKAGRRKFIRFQPREFDIVFMDPPTFAKSPFGTVDIIRDYQGMFKPALLCVKPGGCIICTNHAASVELGHWLDLLKRCAVKAGRPVKDIQVIEPEADFPSPDRKFPLKIAAFEVCRPSA
jgi:23S rRNA (cytosine1962-C5)-methyltransferase